ELYRPITRTPFPVVLPFHVLHLYFLNLTSVVRFCETVNNHKPAVPLVWTLPSHWRFPGRCSFIDSCEGWSTGCQKFPTLT
ncbi:colanic acid biosynthesis glycosyltransferase WcaC, partial [Escherichia coli]|nr:colanic acid biosynthesis glycosyltransferase WcaC [Escherichia coli]